MGCPETPQVNRGLLSVKAAFFFTRASAGSLLVYVVVFMKQKGLTPSEAAVILGATPILTASLRAAVGLLADKIGKHRLVLIVCLMLTCLFMGGMLFLPSVKPSSAGTHISVDLICSPNGSYLRYCSTEGSDQSSCLQTFWEQTVFGNDAMYFEGNGSNQECHVICEVNLKTFGIPICISSDTDIDHICMPDINNISFQLHNLFVKNDHGNNSSATRNDRCGSHTTDFEMHNISIFQDDSASQPSLLYSHMSCESASQVTCQLICPEMFRSSNCEVTRIPFSGMFFVFAILYFVGQVFYDSGISLLDACTYSHIGDEREKWGHQRLWGTIGDALFGVTSGFIMDAVSENHEYIDYTWAFALYIIHNLLAAVAVFFYNGSDNVRCSQSFNKTCKVIRNGEVACLLLVSLVLGMYPGIYEVFVIWHLQTLGASHGLLGLCMVMSTPVEVFFLFFAGHLIKLVGEPVCLYIACFASALRFLAYSFLRNPWWVLAIEPLTGFTYAIVETAVTSYGSRLTPPGMHGLMQGLIGAAHFGFGKGLGGLVAGPVFERYGAAITFQAIAVFAIIAFVFYFQAQLWLSWRAKRCLEDDKEGKDASPEETTMIPVPADDVHTKVRDDTDI